MFLPSPATSLAEKIKKKEEEKIIKNIDINFFFKLFLTFIN